MEETRDLSLIVLHDLDDIVDVDDNICRFKKELNVVFNMEVVLFLSIFVAIVQANGGVSSKLDFDEASDSETTLESNSTQLTNDDVEVKHTIVVSTKLKNNNRRGLHSDGNSGFIMQGRSQMKKKTDSGEIPVYRGFKAVETTHIRTPDSRYKPKDTTPDIIINRNIGDEIDAYPNLGTSSQWRPSTFYNNINYWNPDDNIVTYNINRKPQRTPSLRDEQKYQRKLSEEAVKEFYCCKCREMTRNSRGAQRSNPFETTTPKIKIDGKLAKLN